MPYAQSKTSERKSIISDDTELEIVYLPFATFNEVGTIVEGTIVDIREEGAREVDGEVFGPQRVYTLDVFNATDEDYVGKTVQFGVPQKWKSVILALDKAKAKKGDDVAFVLADTEATKYDHDRFVVKVHVAKN